MAVLYTPKEMQEALTSLRIKPVRGLVNTKEAANILSWRSEAEYSIKHDYPEAAVRRHVQRDNLEVAETKGGANYFKVEKVFEVPLTPRRGIAQKKTEPRLPAVGKDDAA